MRPADLLVPRPEGLYCPPGGLLHRPGPPGRARAVTHAHSDHATPGHGAVLATRETLDIMAIRLGDAFAGATQAASYGEAIALGGVTVAFHPAGHVLGSAQIEVAAPALRIVAAGDYKRTPDPTCTAFQPMPCDVFITEATFAPAGLPPPAAARGDRQAAALSCAVPRAHPPRRLLRARQGAAADRGCCARPATTRPIFLHGALRRLCDYYVAEGIALGELSDATLSRGRARDFAGQIVLGPPSAFEGAWIRRFTDPLIAFASGWMQVRARARQRGVELPLIISDHCDWPELTSTIAELDPSQTWVTHGREEALVRWCTLQGRTARPLHLVGYEDEAED